MSILIFILKTIFFIFKVLVLTFLYVYSECRVWDWEERAFYILCTEFALGYRYISRRRRRLTPPPPKPVELPSSKNKRLESRGFFARCLDFLFHSQYTQTYFTLGIYLVVALGLCALLATMAYLFSLSTSQDVEKRSEYECGFAPFDSATRLPFDVHFYLVGILFLIFDVEVALLFPWAIGLNEADWQSFWVMIYFLVILSIGFVYEWQRGALIWPGRTKVN